MVFEDRREAGRLLAKHLASMRWNDPIVLALPRGGVPVAFEVSQSLKAPLDVLVVRKIGAPSNPEFGIGAITEGGYSWIDEQTTRRIQASKSEIDQTVALEGAELSRRVRRYRRGALLPSVKDKEVILVDDGLATGVTAKVACRYLRDLGARRLVLAAPVGFRHAISSLKEEVDELVILETGETFSSVGQCYLDFSQTSDAEVIELLKQAGIDRLPPLSDPKTAAIQKNANPLRGVKDLNPLIDDIAQSRVVMLGEASHGTHEFYEWRREITKALIERHGFDFVAVEGDWPACWELNQFIQGDGPRSSRDALRGFRRWPTWMWANREISGFADWMRAYNQKAGGEAPVGFYGLDVYSLFDSIDALVAQLKTVNPEMALRAREKYDCFGPFRGDERAYVKSLFETPAGCKREAEEMLNEILRLRTTGLPGQSDALFGAEQNARVIRNAELYYRTMIQAGERSWNVRDHHMHDTLEVLLNRYGNDSKAIVWGHNTHIGDYRATPMLEHGEINIGGLARERWGEKNVSLVGFGTYQGKVTASPVWDGPVKTLDVPPGQPGSLEAIMHSVSEAIAEPTYFLLLRRTETKDGPLSEPADHRAIGVVYRPEQERLGNYVPTSLTKRYDAFVFIDETTALTPLAQSFDRREIPETWPRGL